MAAPLDIRDIVGIELRMNSLARRFGLSTFRDAEVILPTAERFPGRWRSTDQEVSRLFDMACDFMGVARGSVKLSFTSEWLHGSRAGHWDASDSTMERLGVPEICVRAKYRDVPHQLLAVFLHELAHERLLRTEQRPESIWGDEVLTDLMPVALGLGVMMANAVLSERSGTTGQWSWWSTNRVGYLPASHLGHALAVFAWVRGEREPAWRAHLRPDAGVTMDLALEQFERTKDCLVDRDDPAALDRAHADPASILKRLSDSSARVRLAALWCLPWDALTGAAAVGPILRMLDDPEASIRIEAAGVLPETGDLGKRAVERLFELYCVGDESERAAATLSLARMNLKADVLIPELTRRLRHQDGALRHLAAAALAYYGAAARDALPHLVAELALAVSRVQPTHELASAIAAVASDPVAAIREALGSDPETCEAAVRALREAQGEEVEMDEDWEEENGE